MLKILIALVVSSALDTAVFKVALSMILTVFMVHSRRTRGFSHDLVKIYFVIFTVGLAGSIYYIIISNISGNLLEAQLYRNRFHLIELLFASTLYAFLITKSKKYIFELLFVGMGVNIVVGVYQFALNPFDRITFMFFEPSAAAMYYIFMFSLIIYEYSKMVNYYKYASYLFLAQGLLVFSKAQYVALLFSIFQQLRKTNILLVLILFLSGIYAMVKLQPALVNSITNFSSVFYEHGLKGLNASYQIYNTWSGRISAFYVSLNLILQNPLGIGFGSFNTMYSDFMSASGLYNYIWSGEIEHNYYGNYYYTSKSILMEIFVSTGFVGIVSYAYLFFRVFSQRKKYKYIYYTFCSLSIIGVIVELAPIFAYTAIVFALFYIENLNSDKLVNDIM